MIKPNEPGTAEAIRFPAVLGASPQESLEETSGCYAPRGIDANRSAPNATRMGFAGTSHYTVVAGLIAGLVGNRGAPVALSLHSPDFHDRGEIPTVHTCEGDDVPPALAWQGPPAGTKSLALIVDDPDAPDPRAPKMTYVHWVLYNIPPDAGGLPGGSRKENLPAGTREGKNDWSRTGYGGPCPPVGRHRYFFKIYALDTVLPERDGLTKVQLEKAMSGHVLARAELVGTYQKKGG